MNTRALAKNCVTEFMILSKIDIIYDKFIKKFIKKEIGERYNNDFFLRLDNVLADAKYYLKTKGIEPFDHKITGSKELQITLRGVTISFKIDVADNGIILGLKDKNVILKRLKNIHSDLKDIKKYEKGVRKFVNMLSFLEIKNPVLFKKMTRNQENNSGNQENNSGNQENNSGNQENNSGNQENNSGNQEDNSGNQ